MSSTANPTAPTAMRNKGPAGPEAIELPSLTVRPSLPTSNVSGPGDSIFSDSRPFAGMKDDDERVVWLRAQLRAKEVEGMYNRQSWTLNFALDGIGFGRYHWMHFFVAFLGWMVDNMCIQGLAICLPWLAREFEKGEQDARQLTMSLGIGMAVGAFSFSQIGDRVGRRTAYLTTVPLAGICMIAATFQLRWYALCICLSLTGTGVGGNLPTDGVYFVEFGPPSESRKQILLGSAWATGFTIVNSIAYSALLYASCTSGLQSCTATQGVEPCCNLAKDPGWRIVFGVTGFLAIIIAVVRTIALPALESPKFLIKDSKEAEAVAVLERVALYNRKVTWLNERILLRASQEDVEQNATNLAPRTGRILRFFGLTDLVAALTGDKELRRTIVALAFIFPIVGLAYPLFAAFIAQFFCSVASGPDGMTDDTLLRSNLAIALITLPSATTAYFLAGSRLGRKWTLVFSTLASGIMLFLFAFLARENSAIAFTGFALICQNVMYSTLFAYVPERVPAPIRTRVNGILSGMNRITGLAAPIIATFAHGMDDKAFICLSGGMFCFAALVFMFISETRDKAAL